MSNDAVMELRQLREQVAALMDCLTPFVSTDEMCKRYNCTAQTLTAMEKRGEIPFRVRGRWLRSELLEWQRRG